MTTHTAVQWQQPAVPLLPCRLSTACPEYSTPLPSLLPALPALHCCCRLYSKLQKLAFTPVSLLPHYRLHRLSVLLPSTLPQAEYSKLQLLYEDLKAAKIDEEVQQLLEQQNRHVTEHGHKAAQLVEHYKAEVGAGCSSTVHVGMCECVHVYCGRVVCPLMLRAFCITVGGCCALDHNRYLPLVCRRSSRQPPLRSWAAAPWWSSATSCRLT